MTTENENQPRSLDTVLEPLSAIEAISRAELDQQITTARRFPRSLSQVKREMTEMATIDEKTAASCFYLLPRAGKNIIGPSIRLAEIAFACYGNVRVGTRIIGTVTEGTDTYVTVQGVAHDLEKNNAVSMEKRRRIVGKKSNNGRIDEDDINLAVNAGSAIALRDALFKIIPGILIKPVYDAARKVAVGNASTLADRRVKCIEAFSKMGVDAARILFFLKKAKVEEISLDDLETLIGTFTAIKEGTTSVDSVFAMIPPKTATKTEKPDFAPPEESTEEKASPKKARKSAAKEAAKEPPTETSTQEVETGGTTNGEAAPPPVTEPAPKTTTTQEAPPWE